MLVSAMDDLNDREQYILDRTPPHRSIRDAEELSQVYGVSRERVRQIEVRAPSKAAKGDAVAGEAPAGGVT